MAQLAAAGGDTRPRGVVDLCHLAGTTTQGSSHYEAGPAQLPVPGLVVVWSGDAPLFRPVPLGPGVTAMGREDLGGVPLPDQRVSRKHAELSFDAGAFQLRDLESTHGTWVDGSRVQSARVAPGSLVRLGHTLLLLLADVRPYTAGEVTVENGVVIGPSLRRVLDQLKLFAQGGSTVLITGENGAGKELAAATFHRAATPRGPLVSVNCATIEKGTADVVLFGALKGTYTDAKADRAGLIESADGGVLFLDELGELPLEVQAKLLRVVESQELMPMGATTPRKVNVRYLAATNRDVRAEVEAGHFRRDLFFRLAQMELRLPPLRERREEIPWLITQAIAKAPPPKPVHTLFVEEALRRPWPGNVRELLAQAQRALINSGAHPQIRLEHLDPNAGRANSPEPQPLQRTQPGLPSRSVEAAPAAPAAPPSPARPQPSKEAVQQALAQHEWNIAAAARALDLHRTQLYRLMGRYGLQAVDGAGPGGAAEE